MNKTISELKSQLQTDSDDVETFSSLAGRLIERGDWRKLVDLYQDFVENDPNPELTAGVVQSLRDLLSSIEQAPEKAELTIVIGDLLARRLGCPAEAVDAYKRAFQLDPDNATSLERARALYRSEPNFRRVLLLYRLQKKNTDDSADKGQLLLNMAYVHGDHLENADRAVVLLDEASQHAGEGAVGIEHLKEAYRQGGDYRTGIETLVDKAESEDEATRAAELYVGAAYLESALESGNDARAVDFADRADSLASDSKVVRSFRAKLDGVDHSESSDNRERNTTDTSSLEFAAKPTRKLSTQQLQAVTPPESDDKQLGELELSGIQQKPLAAAVDAFSGSTQQAFEALESEPGDLSALAKIAEALEQEGAYEELISYLEDARNALRGKPGEVEVIVKLGRLHWEQMGDFEAAEEHFNRLKLLDRTHPAMVSFYEAYYRKQGDWRRLFTFLSSQQRRTKSPENALRIAHRLSEVAEHKMESSERAIGVWKDLLKKHPDLSQPRQELHRLYKEHGKWHALADFLEGEFERLAELDEPDQTEERIEILEQLVPIYRDQLNHDTRLIETLQRLLDLAPKHQTAFNQLRTELRKRGRWSELASLLSERATRTSDADQEIEYRLAIADIWQEELNNPARAIPALKRILSLDPEREESRRRLEKLYEDRRDYEALFDLRHGETELVEGDARRHKLNELADFAERRLGSVERTVDVLYELLEIGVEDEAEVLGRLESIFRRNRDWSALVDVLEQRAEAVDSKSEKTHILLEAADVLHSELDNAEKAIELYRRVLELDADNTQAFESLTNLLLEQDKLGKLRELYIDRQRLGDLYDIVESTAVLSDEVTRARRLYRFMATLAEEDLEDSDRVVASLESLLEIAEDERDVAEELLEWYRHLGQTEGEVEMNRLLLRAANDSEQRLGYLDDLVEVSIEAGKGHQALNWILRAAVEHPDEPEFLEKAEGLARREELLDLFIEKLEALISRKPDRAFRENAWQKVARLLDERGEYRAAIDYYQRLHERHPESLDLHETLQRLYRQTEQHEKLVRMLESEMDLRDDSDRRRADFVNKLTEMADIYRQKLQQPEKSRELYLEVLEHEPEHIRAIQGLRKLDLSAENWEAAKENLYRELALLQEDDEPTEDIEVELAELYHHHLDDGDKALEYYGGVISASEDVDDELLSAVETFLDRESRLASKAASILEPIYRERDNTEDLARALEARLQGVEAAQRRIQILKELVDLYKNKLGQPERAFELGTRWFRADPRDDSVWLILEQLAGKLENWESLEEVFAEALAEHETLDAELTPLLRHLAGIRDDRLDQPKRALKAWERLRDYEPEDLGVLEALEHLYRRLEKPRELLGVLEDQVELMENSATTVQTLSEIGELAENVASDWTRAERAYERILEIDAHSQKAVAGLERVWEETEAWNQLKDLYVDRVAFFEDRDQLDSRRLFERKLASLQFERLDERHDAVERLTDLVEAKPDDEQAVEQLESFAETLKGNERDQQLEYRAVQALEDVYRDNQRQSQLAEALGRRVKLARDTGEATRGLDELAELYLEPLDEPQKAFEVLGQRIVEDPDSSGQWLETFEKLGRQLDRRDDVIDTYGRAVEEASKPHVYWKHLGFLHRERNDELETAISAFEEALQGRPEDVEVLEALEDIYESEAEYSALADNLEAQLNIKEEPETRADLLLRLGKLYDENLDDKERAIEVYDSYRQLRPESLEGLEPLQKLYKETEQWLEYAEVLHDKADLMPEVDRQIETLEALAETYRGPLGDRDSAIETYNAIIDRDKSHQQALDALDELYEVTEAYEQLARILRLKLETTASQTQGSTDLALRLGRVYQWQLTDPPEALELYRSILELQPGQEEAIAELEELVEQPEVADEVAELLEPYYRAESKWDKMVSLYRTRESQVESSDRKAELFGNIGVIQRDYLEQRDEAVDAFAQACLHAPGRAEYLDQLISVVQIRKDWSRLADIYQSILEEVTESDLQLDYELRLADLYLKRLDDPVEAERHYREALEHDPDNRRAYEALEQILRDQQRWLDLVELLEKKVDAEAYDGPQQKRAILEQIAQIQQEQLVDAYSAADTYKAILNLNPEDHEAAEKLEQLLRQKDRWDDLVEFLQGRIEIEEETGRRVSRKKELADILAREFYQPSEACEIYREILEIEPGHEPTIESLEQLFEKDPDFRGEIAELLEPVYRDRNNWQGLIEVLSAKGSEIDRPFEKRTADLREAARVSEQKLEDLQTAFQILGQVFLIAPADDDVRSSLFRLAAMTDSWSKLSDLYEQVLRENLDLESSERVDLLEEHGQILEDRIRDDERAREVFERLLLEESDNQIAIEALDRLLLRLEDYDQLAEFYRQRAASAEDPNNRKHWLYRRAKLYDDVVHDVDRAIDAYFELYNDDPQLDRVHRALVRLLRSRKRWHDLADLFERRLAHESDPESAYEWRIRLAKLQADELDLIEDALEHYRELLEKHPEDEQTLRALEGLRRDLAERKGEWEPLRKQIIDLLLGEYGDEDWRRIADLKREKQKLLSDTAEQIELLRQTDAIIAEHESSRVGQLRGAEALATAFALEPENEQLRQQLAERVNDLDGWQWMLPYVLEGVEATADPVDQSVILSFAADAYAEHLDDTESAIGLFQQVVQLTNDDYALSRLRELYGSLDLWEPLVALLDRQLDREFDTEVRRDLLERVADICREETQNTQKAIEAYEELNRLEPANREYVDALRELYGEHGEYEQLAELILDELEWVEDEETETERLIDLAEIRAEQLDQIDLAIERYRQVLKRVERPEIRAELSRLYRRTGQWRKLIDNLDERIDRSEDPGEAAELQLEKGTVFRDEVDEARKALEAFGQVLESGQQTQKAADALCTLMDVSETRESAANMLKEYFRQTEEADRLEGVLESQLQTAQKPEQRLEAFIELGQFYMERGAPERAFELMSQAMDEHPRNGDVREMLESVAAEAGLFSELADVYAAQVQSEDEFDDPEFVRELHGRLGQIYRGELDEIEKALTHFESALELAPRDPDLLEAIDELYQQTEQWNKLIGILERRVEQATSPEKRAEFQFRLAYLKEVVVEQIEEAFELYERVLEQIPGHEGAMRGLERLVEHIEVRRRAASMLVDYYDERGEYAKLAGVYRLTLEVTEARDEKSRLHRKIADLELEHLDDPESAFEHLTEAFRLSPEDRQLQNRLEKVSNEHGFDAELVDVFEGLIERLGKPERVAELASTAGARAQNQLGDAERAKQLYRRVLDLEPAHREALSALEQITRQQGDTDDLIDVLEHRADLTFEPSERRSLLLELGDAYREQGRQSDAIDAYQQALVLDESDREILSRLAQMYEELGDRDAYISTLERLAPQIEETGEQKQLYYTIATESRDSDGDLDRATQYFEKILDISPDDEEAIEALEQLYRSKEEWTKLEDILARQRDLWSEDAEKLSEICVREAELAYEKFGDPERAMQRYREALEYRASDHVFESLESLYAAENRWEKMRELLEEQLAATEDEQKQARLALRIARIAYEYQDEMAEAVEYLERALDWNPESTEALKLLAEILEQRQAWSELNEVLKQLAQQIEDTDEFEQVRRQQGQLLAGPLERPEDAVACYRDLLDIEPEDLEIIEALEKLYEQIGSDEPLCELLEHKAKVAEQTDQSVRAYRKAAAIAKDNLDDSERAISALKEAYRLDSGATDAVDTLVDLWIESGSLEEADAFLADVIEELNDRRNSEALAHFRHRRGQIAENRDELEQAYQLYQDAHEVDSTYVPNLLSLGKTAYELEHYDHALKIFQTLLLHQANIDSDRDRADMYYYLGRLRQRSGEESRAEDMFNRALSIEPEHELTKQALES